MKKKVKRSSINCVIVVRADGSREEIYDPAFFVRSVAVVFWGRAARRERRT